jgi:tRNA pseudouridine38-40 synthase
MAGEPRPPAGRRIAVLLEYDGTAYRGSQYQENGPSIQSRLEAAINNLTSETVRAAFAGRTDAGVHAMGQVAAFDTASGLTEREFQRGLNHFLPADIVVREVRAVSMAFDPRRDAIARVYRYRIDNRSSRPALDRDRAWHVPQALDVDGIRSAASRLVGEHNFAAFTPPDEASTVRTLTRCDVEGASGADVTVEMEARAFLAHQVRRTVGPLVEVGLGRMSEDELVRILQDAVPSSAGPAAPAKGLYLLAVRYQGFDLRPS